MMLSVRLLGSVGVVMILASPLLGTDQPSQNNQEIQDVLELTQKSWQIPGMTLAVVRGQTTIFSGGVGLARKQPPRAMTSATLMPLASCTKAFTSTLIAMLVDEGKLGWDDPVRKHLPSFRLSDPHADALVTLRDLLSHRTGVGSHDLLWYRASWDLQESIRRTTQMPLEVPFRGGYRYSSTMFTAAGMAAANRMDQPWAELIRLRIAEPLGLSGLVTTVAEAERITNRAEGFHRLRTASNPSGTTEPMPLYRDREANPAGSLWATTHDLAVWLKFHLSGGIAADGRRLLSAETLAETRTPQTVMRLGEAGRQIYPDSKLMAYAMGWVVYDHRGRLVVSHGGMIDGFRVQVTLLPEEQLGIAVMCNLHQTRATNALTNAIIDQQLGLSPRDWNRYYQEVEQAQEEARRARRGGQTSAAEPLLPPTLPLSQYAGRYEHPVYGEGQVTFQDDKLVWQWSSFHAPLEHYRGDQFRVREGFFQDEVIEFQVPAGAEKAIAVKATAGLWFRRK